MTEFVPARSTARYCSATCRQRAARDRRAARSGAEAEAESETPAEHSLVRVTRLTLEKVDAIETVPGQLALQLARRIAKPEESGITAMSTKLQVLLAEAKAEVSEVPSGAGSEPAPESDEVARARARREEIAAAAAAEAEG